VGIIGGALISGTGVTLVVLGSAEKKEGEDGIAENDRKRRDNESPCDADFGWMSTDGTPFACDKEQSDAQEKIDAGKNMSIAGFVGIGVGGAIAATGVVLLLTGDDPDKYEQRKARARGPRFTLVPGPGELGAALRATF
jgi:hypothetical protein